MELRISFRHMEASPSIESKIADKVQHLKKYFRGKMKIDWVCSVEPHQHICEVNIKVDHLNFHAHASDRDLYHCLDLVIEKLEKQLRRKNDKLNDKIHSSKKLGENRETEFI